MLISVIIPHLDDLTRLQACVAALEAQDFPRQDFEIIVADNGSRCGADAIAWQLPSVRVIQVLERGAGPARNGAALEASGSVFAFTDSDCVPAPGWLAAGLAALQTFDIAGGAMTVAAADSAHMTGAEAFESVFAFDNQRYVTELGFSVTANLFTTRAVYEAAGPFPNGVSEDMAWCHAARACGCRIGYAANAIVAHPARHSFAALAHKWRRITSESYALWRAQGRSRSAWLVRAAGVLLSPLWHGVRVIRSDRLHGVTVRAKALAVLTGIRAARAAWMVAALRHDTQTNEKRTSTAGFRSQTQRAIP